MCVCMFCTSYEERGLQHHVRSSEATADAFVGSRIPGLDLGDQQCPIGQKEHSAEEEEETFSLHH